MKVTGVLLGISLMLPFYFYTIKKTKEITGTAEFSVFGGWQIANNALYMYGHINVDSSNIPAETKMLDKLAKSFFAKFHPSTEELSSLPGTYFIKVPYAILKPYMAFNKQQMEDPIESFRAWGQVSPIYKKYGSYLITHYPVPFIQYYLWLNTKNYFLPHLEKFDIYNLGINTVPTNVQDWFDLITPEVYSISNILPRYVFYIYPLLFMMLNLYFFCLLAWIIIRKKKVKISSHLKTSLLFTSVFLFINFCFSVFATPVVLRYQITPLIFLLTYCLLISELSEKIDLPKTINAKS